MDLNDGARKPKFWIMPLGEDGQPDGEPVDISKTVTFNWDTDGGLYGGLPGEQAEAEGSTSRVGDEGWDPGIGRTLEVSWSMELNQEKVYELWALMTGLSVEQVKDLLQWAEESKWLRGMTGDIWNLV